MTAISTFGFLPFVPFVFVVSSWSTRSSGDPTCV